MEVSLVNFNERGLNKPGILIRPIEFGLFNSLYELLFFDHRDPTKYNTCINV